MFLSDESSQGKKAVKKQQADTTTPTAAPVLAAVPLPSATVAQPTVSVQSTVAQSQLHLPAPSSSSGVTPQIVGERRGSARTVRKPKKDLPESPVS